MDTITVKTKTKEYQVKRVANDYNGNPRYVISWLSLGLPKYKADYNTRAAGLSLYRGKDFAGGFVFQSYNIQKDIEYIENSLAGKYV